MEVAQQLTDRVDGVDHAGLAKALMKERPLPIPQGELERLGVYGALEKYSHTVHLNALFEEYGVNQKLREFAQEARRKEIRSIKIARETYINTF